MRVTIRDLFSVAAIVGLLACWRISYLQTEWQGQLAVSRQQELFKAKQRESELAATVDQLTARLDEYENSMFSCAVCCSCQLSFYHRPTRCVSVSARC
jgi:hypothetical protein